MVGVISFAGLALHLKTSTQMRRRISGVLGSMARLQKQHRHMLRQRLIHIHLFKEVQILLSIYIRLESMEVSTSMKMAPKLGRQIYRPGPLSPSQHHSSTSQHEEHRGQRRNHHAVKQVDWKITATFHRRYWTGWCRTPSTKIWRPVCLLDHLFTHLHVLSHRQ